MFMEISVLEQKYQTVLAVIRDGVSIVEVANRFGVSHQSVHSWLLRYEMEGMDPPPSVSGIYRALKRAKTIQLDAPMELWQMDVVGGILLTDNGKVLTGRIFDSKFSAQGELDALVVE